MDIEIQRMTMMQSKRIKIIKKIPKNREMEKKEDKLEIIKLRYSKEKVEGDLSDAARKAKTSVNTVKRGLEKHEYKTLTKDQRRGISELLKILNTRVKEYANLEAEMNV